MFLHQHPYDPYIPEGAQKLIVGTLPPPRFSRGLLKEGDVDFCYGSRDGYLWPVLDRIFGLNLDFETTQRAVDQRKQFLRDRHIGICDIVESAERERIDAADMGMQNIKLRNLIDHLHRFPGIHTLLFTGGNSKNGPEYFFRKQLRDHGISLKLVSDNVPRIHEFSLTERGERTIRTVSLTSPSGSANRAVGSLSEFKSLKSKNPEFNTVDFRVMQYMKYF